MEVRSTPPNPPSSANEADAVTESSSTLLHLSTKLTLSPCPPSVIAVEYRSGQIHRLSLLSTQDNPDHRVLIVVIVSITIHRSPRARRTASSSPPRITTSVPSRRSGKRKTTNEFMGCGFEICKPTCHSIRHNWFNSVKSISPTRLDTALLHLISPSQLGDLTQSAQFFSFDLLKVIPSSFQACIEPFAEATE